MSFELRLFVSVCVLSFDFGVVEFFSFEFRVFELLGFEFEL